MYKYLTYLPNKYTNKKKYPLLIFLHGTPQQGNDLELLKKGGLPYELENKTISPQMIVAAPQCPQNTSWDIKKLYDTYIDIYKKYKLDIQKIYLTGYSIGGFYSIKFAAEYNKIFAAVAPVCSGGAEFYAQKIKNIPFWFFHGTNDKVININETKELVDKLKNINAEVKLSILENRGHDIWNTVYKNQNLYEWLLSHHL